MRSAVLFPGTATRKLSSVVIVGLQHGRFPFIRRVEGIGMCCAALTRPIIELRGLLASQAPKRAE